MSASQGPGVGTSGALDEVAGLVSRWRQARGSMDRVRVIASGTRTLGSMSPDDRRVLAQAVAERGSPEIAARLGPPDGGGPSSSELTELTRALLSVDRAELDGLAASLGDPDERRRLLLAATDAVADPDAQMPPPPTGTAVPLPPPSDAPGPSHAPGPSGAPGPSDTPAGRPARTAPQVPPLREAPELSSTALGSADLGAADLGAADLGTAELGTAALGTAALGGAALGSVERGRDTTRGGSSAVPSATARPPAAEPRPPAPEPTSTTPRGSTRRRRPAAARSSGPVDPPASTREPTPEAVAAPDPVPPREPVAAPRARPSDPALVGRVVDDVGRATSARGRLLAVARLEGAPLTGRDLDALLAQVPDGWQRRTAAVRLLEAGAIERVDPVGTVDAFARDSDRIAVAGVLVAAGLADPDEVASALPERAADRLRRRAAVR